MILQQTPGESKTAAIYLIFFSFILFLYWQDRDLFLVFLYDIFFLPEHEIRGRT